MESSPDTEANNNSAMPAIEKDSESRVISHTLQLVIKKWWLFLIIGIATGIAGYIYASRQKPVYESYLSFALDEGGSEGGASGAMGIAAQFGISLGGAKDVFTGDNILEIMLSRRVIEKALLSVDSFNNKPYTLIEYYLENEDAGDKNKIGRQVHFLPNESRDNFTYTKDSLLYKTFLTFQKNYILARRPDKKLNIYELSVSSHNEVFSKIFTDKLIEETNKFYVDISSKKAKSTLDILEQRVPAMKGKLDATISSKAAIQDANLNTAFASAQVPILKAQTNTQVYAGAYSELYKNLEMARIQYLKSIPLMQIIDDADYPMKKIMMGKAKTAIIFSVIGCFIAFLILMVLNIFRYNRTSN